MGKDYILALDQGTTSSRAIVFDKQGNIVSKAQKEFEQIYPQTSWVEHDPMEILYSQFQSVTSALSTVSAEDIAAIGITNQRETTVIWEKATGKPIYKAIVWQCRRTADISEELIAKGLSDYIADKTGLLPDAYFSGTKIKWILDNVPLADCVVRSLLDLGHVDRSREEYDRSVPDPPVRPLHEGREHVERFGDVGDPPVLDRLVDCDIRRCLFIHVERVVADGEYFAVVLERDHVLFGSDLPGMLAVYFNGAGPEIDAVSVMYNRIVKFHALLRKQEVLLH